MTSSSTNRCQNIPEVRDSKKISRGSALKTRGSAACLEEVTAMLWRGHRARNDGLSPWTQNRPKLTASKKARGIVLKPQDSDNSKTRELRRGPWASDKITAPANPEISAWWETQGGHSYLDPYSWPTEAIRQYMLFEAIKFVVTCYVAIEN